MKRIITIILAVLVSLLVGFNIGKQRTPSLIVCSMNTFENVDDPLLGPGQADASDDCYIGTFRGERVKVLILD